MDVRKKFEDMSRPVRDARRWIRDRAKAGEAAQCPCCERPIGYEQRLEHAHVVELMRFARAAFKQSENYGGRLQDQGIHVPTVLGRDAESYSQNCLSQLRHFGLVEPSGSKPGWWKLTKEGVGFLLGRAAVHRAAWMFKSELMFFIPSAGEVNIHDLVKPHEYDRYMKEGLTHEGS